MAHRPLAENSSSSATGRRRSRSRSEASSAKRLASALATSMASASEAMTCALSGVAGGVATGLLMGWLLIVGDRLKAFNTLGLEQCTVRAETYLHLKTISYINTLITFGITPDKMSEHCCWKNSGLFKKPQPPDKSSGCPRARPVPAQCPSPLPGRSPAHSRNAHSRGSG